jgi:hypothetical protein
MQPLAPAPARPPDWRERLRDAFAEAFQGDWHKLEQMMLLRLDIRLGNVVERGPLEDVVFSLLFTWAEGEGRLPEVVAAACRHTRAEALLDVAAQLGWAPGPADSSTEAVASVRTGLRALGELLQDPAVRTALAAFRAVLEGADRRIQKVADYKDLHDRLHDLQFRCLEPIASASRSFPGGGTAEQLKFDAITLRAEYEKVRVIVGRPTLAGEDFAWVDEELAACAAQLGEAIEQNQPSKLQQIVRGLRNIIQVQPTLLNKLLVQAVEFLDLGALVRRLQEVSSELARLGADADQRGWVEKGTSDLAVLDDALRGAVQRHRAWQRADNDLRLCNTSRGGSADELAATWAGVERSLARVVTIDPSTRELPALAALVKAAIADRDESKVAVVLLKFQTLASDRFYQVDKELKQLCDRIAPVGRDLDTLVGQLEATA